MTHHSECCKSIATEIVDLKSPEVGKTGDDLSSLGVGFAEQHVSHRAREIRPRVDREEVVLFYSI
jgi:hypothetical protein